MKYKVDLPIKIRLNCTIRKKESWYIANCHHLDLITQGETEEIAKDNLIELINDFFFYLDGFFTLRKIKRLSKLGDLYYQLY